MECGGARIGFRFTRRTTVIGDASEKGVDESGVAYRAKMKKKEDKKERKIPVRRAERSLTW